MPRIGIKLRESVKANGVRNTVELVREGLAKRKISYQDISLKEMAVSFMGEDFADKLVIDARMQSNRLMMRGVGKDDDDKLAAIKLQESTTATDASAFSAIMGQLLVDRTLAKYQLATNAVADKFYIDTITDGNISTYRQPGLSYVRPINSTYNLQAQQPYMAGSFQARYIDLPAPERFGEICRVDITQVIGDRTRQVYESADSVGTIVGKEEAYRKIRVMAGLVNPFSWNGTAYNTYLTSGSWINSITNFVFTDWNSMNQIEQLFANMIDPVTGYPIEIDPKDIVSTFALKYPIKRTLNATEVQGGTASTSNTRTITSGPVLDPDYSYAPSKDLRKVLTDGWAGTSFTSTQADTMVIAGDFQKAFGWRQVWPTRVVQAPPMAPAEFEQDIVLQVKASFWGVAYVNDPRYVVRAYNT